jgi:hypothetical protein
MAYADPPYFGMGKKMYGKLHPEAAIWDDAKSHIDLMHSLDEEYDAWAFSLTTTSLRILLPESPEGTRVAAWVKPFAAWRPNHRVQYTWEPIIFKTERSKGGRGIPSVRDHISCNIAMKKGLQGAKPDGFNDYILNLLGYEEGDEFVDLFPGTNGMQEAIDRAIVRDQELEQLEMEA